MRYDVPDHHTDDESRIIYLGEIRRRRHRGRSPDRYYLAAIALLAVVAWASWLAVLFNLAPSHLLSYAGFLVPLWVALAATGTLAAYGFDEQIKRYSDLRVAVRRGLTLASLVAVNLAVAFAHHWNLVIGAVSLLLGVAAEVVQDRRRAG